MPDFLLPVPVVYGMVIAALPTLFCRRLRPLALFLLAACWALNQFQARLGDRLDPELTNQVVSTRGVVASIPSVDTESARFLFRVDRAAAGERLPETLLLTWYRPPPEIAAGERWRLQIKIKPPWGSVNFQGPDRERWLFASGIGGLGTIKSGTRMESATGWRYRIDSWRERVLDGIARQVTDQRRRGVVQALATADRSGVDSRDRALLTATGTAHLLAISGLHVGLAAAGGAWLGRGLLLILPISQLGMASMALGIGGGLLSALAYAALAGFGIPTLRAILMLAAVISALAFSRPIHPARAWFISLALILLMDPFAPLRAGLWFSFMAVAALIWTFLPRAGMRIAWKTMLMAQAGVILVLTPISAFWFGAFSPVSFFANLLAIPWVSFLVVPPILAGLGIFPISEVLAGNLWAAAGFAVSVLFNILEILSALQGRAVAMAFPTLPQTVLAVVGAAFCMLPRGIPARWLGLFLIVPLFLPAKRESAPGRLEAEILDVGQGTAVLVSSGNHSLLYDSGPGDGRDWNLVASVIDPALARLGPGAPEMIVISHGDMDHAGGLRSLLERHPDANFQANLPKNGVVADHCVTPFAWAWPGVTARVLHPSPWLPYQGNNSSCVLSIRTLAGNLLLSGDISDAIESRLVRSGLAPHRVLLVPHHGSATSSSPEFINRLAPEIAIATASLGNRFDFPNPQVRERYEAAGTLFWSTGECGAIRVVLDPGGSIRAVSARRNRMRIWRWPPAANCP